MYFVPNFRSYKYILEFWFVGSCVSLVIGVIAIYNYGKPWIDIKNMSWNKKYILKGYKTGFLFFFSTLSFRGIQTFDRILIEKLNDPQILGVYVFFVGAAMSIKQIIEPSIIQFGYPKMIYYFKNMYYENFLMEYKHFKLNINLMSSSLVILLFIIMPYMLDWINKDEYKENIYIFWFCLIAVLFILLSNGPHYFLYAMSRDNIIIRSHILSISIFLFATFILSYITKKYAVLISVSLTYFFLFLYKQVHANIELKKLREKLILSRPYDSHLEGRT